LYFSTSFEDEISDQGEMKIEINSKKEKGRTKILFGNFSGSDSRNFLVNSNNLIFRGKNLLIN